MPDIDVLKSEKVREHIRDWIHSGRLTAGARLPSERLLAQQLGVTHITIRRGLADLVDEGLIIKRPNVGNFVKTSSRAMNVAIVVPESPNWACLHDCGHPLFTRLIEGIHATLDPCDYVVSSLTYRRGHIWDDVGHILTDRSVQGILLAGQKQITYEDAARLNALCQHVVLIKHCPQLQMFGWPIYEIDFTNAMFSVISRLAELGHRAIRVVLYQVHSRRKQWFDAMQAACSAHGLGDASQMVVDHPDFGEPGSEGVIESILDEQPLPTAVVLPDEYQAAKFFRLCYRRNIRVPDDISLVAMYNSTDELHPVPLTSVHTAELARKFGSMAAEHLDSLMQGEQIEARTVLLHGQITWTESIGPVRA